MKRWWLVTTLVVLVVGAVSCASLLAWTSERRDERALLPLEEAIGAFPTPVGATQSIPEVKTLKPLLISHGWSHQVSLDVACPLWGDAFRTWVGEQNTIGSVTGEYAPGQSCNFEGIKDGYNASLSVAVYGTEPPLAMLTIERKEPDAN